MLEAYGRPDYDNERLEGFNRKGESYLGPYATAHTAIHEVLHTLSSQFDYPTSRRNYDLYNWRHS